MDPAEGNVNHLHALPEWAVTATLVRENQPVLTAVHLPLTGETYTALTGAGAHLDGRPLHVSQTADLGLSIVATSQARPDEDEKVVRRVGSSITAMLFDALVVRVAVPATLHLLNVAAGRIDAFWQFAGRPRGPASRSAARHRGRRTDLRRRGPPLDPPEPELCGRRAGRPRRGRVHALALTAHYKPHAHGRTRSS